MYKKIIIASLILVLLMYGIIDKEKGAPDLYFADIEKSSIRLVGDRTYNVSDVIWSGDSRFFMFYNEKGNYICEVNSKRTGLDSTTAIEVSELPDGINVHYHSNTGSFWVRANGEISDWPENMEEAFAILGTKEGDEKWLTYNEEAELKIRNYLGSDYFEAYISNDGKRVLFRGADYKVYLMDLNTGVSKFLFQGCNLDWSSNETKISFGIPHEDRIEDVDDMNSYDSNMLISYVYDLNTGKSIKVADFGIQSFFSFDDKYLIFYESSYIGPRGGSE